MNTFEINKIIMSVLLALMIMKAGDIITRDAVRSVRPGYGVPPKYLDKVVGMTLAKNVQRNTAVVQDAIFEKIDV